MKYAKLLRHEREQPRRGYPDGMTQVELAAKAGVARAYLNKVENGQHAPHVAKQVRRIERALRIKDKRLLIASMVDRGEIDVSHMTRTTRERFARLALGIADAPVASAEWPTLDRREAEAMRGTLQQACREHDHPIAHPPKQARKEPRAGTLNARVLAVLREAEEELLPGYIADTVVPAEPVERISNALSSLRTAGWATCEPGRNGRERLWSLA